jgi:hypothetical protein
MIDWASRQIKSLPPLSSLSNTRSFGGTIKLQLQTEVYDNENVYEICGLSEEREGPQGPCRWALSRRLPSSRTETNSLAYEAETNLGHCSSEGHRIS